MAEGRSIFKALPGTHFFNPPRYLKLLEIIPTEAVSRSARIHETIRQDVLGKVSSKPRHAKLSSQTALRLWFISHSPGNAKEDTVSVKSIRLQDR
jgi:hypothetical protein